MGGSLGNPKEHNHPPTIPCGQLPFAKVLLIFPLSVIMGFSVILSKQMNRQ